MTWYKPWTWGKDKAADSTLIYCDNPQCRKPIKGDEFEFDSQRSRLYHPGCGLVGCAWDAFTTGNVSCMNVESITREQALGVVKERKSGLEKKVE